MKEVLILLVLAEAAETSLAHFTSAGLFQPAAAFQILASLRTHGNLSSFSTRQPPSCPLRASTSCYLQAQSKAALLPIPVLGVLAGRFRTSTPSIKPASWLNRSCPAAGQFVIRRGQAAFTQLLPKLSPRRRCPRSKKNNPSLHDFLTLPPYILERTASQPPANQNFYNRFIRTGVSWFPPRLFSLLFRVGVFFFCWKK